MTHVALSVSDITQTQQVLVLHSYVERRVSQLSYFLKAAVLTYLHPSLCRQYRRAVVCSGLSEPRIPFTTSLSLRLHSTNQQLNMA